MSKKHGNNKKVPQVMYIYCEGEKTEPLYLEAYISDRSKRTLSVFKIPKTRKNTPEQLVDEAIKKKNSSSSAEGDVFWVVYDQEHLTPSSISCHQKAWNKANRHGINIAISCVCFELGVWGAMEPKTNVRVYHRRSVPSSHAFASTLQLHKSASRFISDRS